MKRVKESSWKGGHWVYKSDKNSRPKSGKKKKGKKRLNYEPNLRKKVKRGCGGEGKKGIPKT